MQNVADYITAFTDIKHFQMHFLHFPSEWIFILLHCHDFGYSVLATLPQAYGEVY